jgi:hypothetical protein
VGEIEYDGDVDDMPKWAFERYFKPADNLIVLPDVGALKRSAPYLSYL